MMNKDTCEEEANAVSRWLLIQQEAKELGVCINIKRSAFVIEDPNLHHEDTSNVCLNLRDLEKYLDGYRHGKCLNG